VVAASGAGTDPAADCLIVHESASLAAFATDVSIADPLFVDPEGADYHLRNDSLGVDRCPEIGWVWLNAFDVDGDGVQDDPGAGNASGISDAGGDELGGHIFADGFERGDTSGWSSAVP